MKYSVIKIKFIIFMLIIIVLLSSNLFAGDLPCVLVVDENNNPLFGYKVLETPKDDVFLGKVEALKKWIILSKSELYIAKNGYLYPVKNSVIIDKAQGTVLYLVDLSDKRHINFSLEKLKIDSNIKSILDNKRKLLSKLEALFPPSDKERDYTLLDRKEMNLLDLARQYERIGQIQKAIEVYEELLKSKNFSLEILSKIAFLYYKSGNFNKAKEYIIKLPKDDENIKKLIGILIIEKNFEEALKILNSDNLKDKGYFHYLRGIIFYLMDKRNEAYREIIELTNIDLALAESLRDLLR